ncbi:PQQ-binding-like beta-propeller repeat protein [Cereibacter azotoformans]|uniref:outer membrane protein assembly factor BamB family protein n=1 Tax=Cereibacter azotoformans TaxID=43057 RepID=UPI0015E7CD61|nr:PQQ-binding-like beta-propeller repeat protein [Cereibacter azotoformans]MBO4168154.1 PQQ-binding-like beta-propeller repeat protein [Cereibacter azotoformans]
MKRGFTVKRTAAVTGFALLGLLGACGERELILPGERFDVRAPLDASVPTEGNPAPADRSGLSANRSLPVALPAATVNASWPQRGGNAAHLAPHASLSAAPQLVWSSDIGAGNSRRNRISAAPVVAEGRVFTMDAMSDVQATSTGGAQLWRVDITPPSDRATDLSGGGLAYGAGRLFATTGFGELVALDPATGAVLWRQKLGAPATGAPMVEGETVYVTGRDSSAWAIDASNGRVRWQLPGAPSSTGMIGGSAPAMAGGTVLFPFNSGQMIAVLREGGSQLWSSQVAGERLGRAYTGFRDITGDPVVSGGTIYVGSSAGRTLAMSAASGETLWSADEGALAPVAVAGGSVFLVSDEARLVRLDAATGSVIWSVDMPYWENATPKRRKGITAHYGPVLAGGRLLVASSDGLVRFFNPADGALVGSAELPGGAAAQPALAGGTLYVVAANGKLLAFR